jgi:hypothetical protein
MMILVAVTHRCTYAMASAALSEMSEPAMASLITKSA